jgi:hypothetical protein
MAPDPRPGHRQLYALRFLSWAIGNFTNVSKLLPVLANHVGILFSSTLES